MTLAAELRAALREAADPALAPGQQAYMKSALPFRGLTSPELKALLRPLLADAGLRIGDRATWESAVRELWDGATHREERYAATALAGHRAYRAWQDAGTLSLYRHLVVTGAWWDHVDEVATHLVGPILVSDKEKATPVVWSWATDEDLWLRRAAVIAQLGARDRTDLALLRHAIEANLDDPSFWLRKAVGWALRQYARTDPEWVRDRVAEWDGRLSALSRREALKHL